MAYIPPNTEWYLADIVMQNTIEGEGTFFVLVNLRLVRADSPDEAYDKALSMGQQSEVTYTNTDGKRVDVHFRGLRDLYAICGSLEDGAEILYEEFEDMELEDVARLVKRKEELRVFEPTHESG